MDGILANECMTEAWYGLLNEHLATQFSMNTDQYTKTINAAMDILANHKSDSTPPNKKFKASAEENEQVLNTSFAQYQNGKQL